MSDGISNPGSSTLESDPAPFHGWQIALSNGSGPFGSETSMAIAEKNGSKIAASAWRPDMAIEMIQSMIRLRENLPSPRPVSQSAQEKRDSAPATRNTKG